jgi:hypothetical protein
MPTDRTRLRPTRAGIVGLWDYTEATFAFADGRMVLRGANGSGKTKALEVLFPFVLDGRLDARRLDPFSGENRTMKENLLWRGTDTGHGYAWLEFAGPAEHGDGRRHLTVGVGLQAQRHRQQPRSWFFVAEGRVGEDIVLVDDDHRPRTRRALADHLGDGVVHDRASDHRRRVDETLFGLGSERFEAMLDLVLTLRRPMLAKDLDPRVLSETLTRGLRPLDDDLLEQVARSFDDLEAVQRDLDHLIAADEAARAFLTDYRGYLRTQARYRADQVIEAAAEHARTAERVTAAEHALDEARAAETLAETEASAAEERLAEDRARRDALRASEAFRTAGELEHLERSVRELADAARRATARAEQADERARAADAAREQAVAASARTRSEVDHLRPQVTASATAAGITWDDGAELDEQVVRRNVGARAAARRSDLEVVRARLAELADAQRRAATTEQAAEEAETADEQAAGALAAREHAVTDARVRLHEDLTTWAEDHAAVVGEDDRAAVLATVAERYEGAEAAGRDEDGGAEAACDADVPAPEGMTSPASPGPEAATPAQRWAERLEPRRAEVTDERARRRATAAALTEQLEGLEQRRRTILEERDDAPPSLPWHGSERDARQGAPLWRLVRFRDGLDGPAAAGVEAALEAAGLLDAWVTPEGQIAGGDHEAFLTPAPTDAAGAGARSGSLADVLVPEEQDHVPQRVVTAVLRSVQLEAPPAVADHEPDVAAAAATAATPAHSDIVAETPTHAAPEPRQDGTAWVAADGRYRLGPLTGSHGVAVPRYIGATAREAHRAARVAALDAEIAEVRADAANVADAIAELDRWLAAATAATAALPSTAPLRDTERERDLAAGRRQQARAALQRTRAAAAAARREVNDRRDAAQREARTRQLPASDEGVAQVTAALERFVTDGTALEHALGRAALREEAVTTATDQAAERRADAEVADDEATDRHHQHDRRRVELDTLRDRLGADVQAVLTELEQVETAIGEGEALSRRLATEARQAAAARGQAEGEVGSATEARRATEQRLSEVEQDLAVLTRADLAGPLGLEVLPDTSADELLEAVDALTIGTSSSEERRKAARTRITRGLEDLDRALGAGYHPAWDVEDDVIVVTVADDLGVRSVAAFTEQLATERAEQEALLTARERALFEDALLTSVCGQIHTRTQATRELVATMDAEMRARRLSSGQTVGVTWRADDHVTSEWKQVHRLLDQDPAHFGPDQLESLRRHFSTEIKAARAADPQAPYRELLAEVLDYRRWRRFELFLVEPDGSQALLTRARHARLSGGEKAASLHLPLFAAAHAAFKAARPGCPRLLGLDEAFAGIDEQGRRELLSLTVAFDLDLFMTGYDLWAIDRSVPGVAHHDLLHLPDEHAVSSLLIVWNGHELLEGPDAEVALAQLGGGPA